MSFAEMQAALNEKTREAERLQELLLAVTPAPGVVPSKLADIQVRVGGGRGLRLHQQLVLQTSGRCEGANDGPATSRPRALPVPP